jgi:hypothetical protein
LDIKEYPSWVLPIENEIIIQWKKLYALSREEASFEYIQRLKSFSLEEGPKDLRKGLEVTVKGLTTMDFLKKSKYRLEFDFTSKHIHFFDGNHGYHLRLSP